MRVGITLTSSLEVGQEYIDLTHHVATYLAEKGVGIVYGGTAYGMMIALGKTYKQAGGKDLNGILAKDLMRVTKNYVAYEGLDRTYIEETMEDRKRKIIDMSDALLILPGGYGTFEEIGTIVGGKANKIFNKPIVFYNYDGFYDTLLQYFNEIHAKQFSKISPEQLVLSSSDMDEILNYFQSYESKELVDKFVRS